MSQVDLPPHYTNLLLYCDTLPSKFKMLRSTSKEEKSATPKPIPFLLLHHAPSQATHGATWIKYIHIEGCHSPRHACHVHQGDARLYLISCPPRGAAVCSRTALSPTRSQGSRQSVGIISPVLARPHGVAGLLGSASDGSSRAQAAQFAISNSTVCFFLHVVCSAGVQRHNGAACSVGPERGHALLASSRSHGSEKAP